MSEFGTRVTCKACGRLVGVTRGGRVRPHRVPREQHKTFTGPPPDCDGSLADISSELDASTLVQLRR